MKTASNNKITRYDIDKEFGFFYLIEETPDQFDAWIGLDSYGVMSYVVGVPKKNTYYGEPVSYGLGDVLEMLDEEEDIAMFLMEYDEIEDAHPEIYAAYDYPLYLVRTRAQFCEDKAAIARELVAAGIDLNSDTWDERIADLVQSYEEEYDIPEGYLS